MTRHKRNSIFKRPKIEFFNTFDREEFLLLILKGILIGIVAGTLGSPRIYGYRNGRTNRDLDADYDGPRMGMSSIAQMGPFIRWFWDSSNRRGNERYL